MQDAFTNPDLSINCFYEDAVCARIVLSRFGLHEGFDVTSETAARIKAEIGKYEESRDGYDEDPSATVYFLHPNQLGQHLNEAETSQLKAAIVRMWHEANPDASSFRAPRNRGSMNVMNRIATKRSRRGSFF